MQDHGYEKSAHLYDLFDKKDNVPFFLHYGRAAGEILDVGAGTGRIAIPLAEEGVKVICIEPSPAMRAIFEEKLSQRSEIKKNIILIDGEARRFDLGRAFSAAFLSGTFDHFLNHDERLTSLLNIKEHLYIGGTLIFDAFIGLMKESPLSPAGEVVQGDRIYRRSVASKPLPDLKLEIRLVYEILEDDVLIERIEQESFSGMIDRKGIHTLLKRTGFEVEEEYGNYQWHPYQENDEILIIQAVRRK